MIVQVNTATYIASELLLDAGLSPVTDKINGDWTKTATLLGTATTATPTITHRANGYYDVLVTFPSVGVWSVEYSVVVNGETVRFDPKTVQVVTAAQFDPASDVRTVLTDSRAAKIDLIGSYAVSGPTTDLTSTDIELIRGSDYLTADGRARTWTSDAWADLTDATISFVVTAGRTAVVSNTGTVVTPTGDAVVSVELTGDDVDAIDATITITTYVLSAVLGTGGTVVLAKGEVTTA